MLPESLVFRLTDHDVLTAPSVCGLVAIPDLLHRVQRWCVDGGPVLVVDLSRVEELELPAFRALWWARQYCAAHGRELVVVSPARVQPHDVSLLLGLLRPYDDVASAQAASSLAGTLIPA